MSTIFNVALIGNPNTGNIKFFNVSLGLTKKWGINQITVEKQGSQAAISEPPKQHSTDPSGT